MRLNPANDLIYVVSEGNGQIQRYRHDAAYAFVDVFAQLSADFHPTGVAFGPGGEVFVASYGESRVAELDPETGVEIATPLPSGSGLEGADNGMMVSANGKLYVPGYDSSTVARVELASGTIDADFRTRRHERTLRNARHRRRRRDDSRRRRRQRRGLSLQCRDRCADGYADQRAQSSDRHGDRRRRHAARFDRQSRAPLRPHVGRDARPRRETASTAAFRAARSSR